jgi:predicted RNase H-like nuclease
MFGDGAPIWGFLDRLRLSGDLDPDAATAATSGRFAFEIYPAAALIGLCPEFHERSRCAKYNPAKRKTFTLADWGVVCRHVGNLGHSLGVAGIQDWATAHSQIERPRKTNQDCLDAAICVLITYLWWRDGLTRSLVVGDTESGYIVTPTNEKMSETLRAAACRLGVPIRGAN